MRGVLGGDHGLAGSDRGVVDRVDRDRTVAGTESMVPSLATKVKLSEPWKLAAGRYVRAGATPLRVPFAGPLTTV